jgi:hypothetical protein
MDRGWNALTRICPGRLVVAMLRCEVPEAREILRNLVVDRIVFTPRPEARA